MGLSRTDCIRQTLSPSLADFTSLVHHANAMDIVHVDFNKIFDKDDVFVNGSIAFV